MQRNHIKAFTGPRAEARAERAGNWLKALAGVGKAREWCVENRIALTKATNESGNSAGGYLVPTELDQAIISVRDTVGAFRNAEVRPIGTVNNVRPRRIGGLTANFVSEMASIPESSFQLDAVNASLRKMAILARSSSELFEDSAADLGEFIASEAGYAFAGLEDDCGFNGDGTSAYSKISGLGTKLSGNKSAVATATGHNTFLTIDNTDIQNLLAGVLASAVPTSRWYISAIGYAQCFCRLALGGVGNGLVAQTNADGSISANYLGFPVVFSSKLPNSTGSLAGKPMLFFGDLRQSSVIVERNSATVVATSYDRYLDTDQVLVRAVRREDIINHTTGDASTLAPVASLFGTT